MESGGGGERGVVGEGSPERGGEEAAAREQHRMRWESILPRRALRVMLVESDDSTRHIVTALLRKCNYRVAGVADGMKAWEVMTEKRYCFDLVLTEVAMPSLSGIGLLSKIMSEDECKNIPVVMMSSHDSVNVVLKCMLKGAVDFLVKPVRKNELRNLWQHVWRRHCSNIFMNASDNTTGSNQISANVGGRSKTEENSDERSDAQSSGSKRDVELESMQNQEGPPHVDDRTGPDTFDKDKAIMASGDTRDYNPVEIRVNVTLPIQEASVANASEEQNVAYDISSYREENCDLVRSMERNSDDPKTYCQNNAPNESVQNKIVFVKPISNGQCSYAVLQKNVPCETANTPYENDASKVDTLPIWELSLRRPESNGFAQIELKEKHVLKQSVASAFTRYDDNKIHSSLHKPVSSNICVRSNEYAEKCNSLNDNEKNSLFSPQANGGETTMFFQDSYIDKENATLPSLQIENGHATPHPHCHPFGFIPLPIHLGPIPYPSLMQPLFYSENSTATQIPPDHSLHHNIHSSPFVFQHQTIDISEPRDLREHLYQSGSCSHEFVKGSGSIGSGGNTDGARNFGNALESGNESGVQNCKREVLDSDRSRREAALIKFRLKRKDRCFEKKVRYVSRKQLAEQRPRVKGQFVRQKVTDTRTTEAEN